MSDVLNSQRLRLRPCAIADCINLHALWIEAEVRRFLFDDRQISLDEAHSLIEASLNSFAQHGYGVWLFFQQQHDEIAGFAGLLHSDGAAPSLIFGTHPQWWGRGYAREAALTILCYAFAQLGIQTIRADVDAPNAASVRVLESLGMSRSGSAIVNQRPLLYYEIHKPCD